MFGKQQVESVYPCKDTKIFKGITMGLAYYTSGNANAFYMLVDNQDVKGIFVWYGSVDGDLFRQGGALSLLLCEADVLGRFGAVVWFGVGLDSGHSVF